MIYEDAAPEGEVEVDRHPLTVQGRKQSEVVTELLRTEEDYRRALEPRFQQIVKNWKRYFNNRTDHRIKGEEWRAFTARPTAFQITETLVSVNVDLITSSDPMVQTEGVGLEDDPSARAVEREVDWALRRNKFNIHVEHMQRAKRVQGISVGKVRWQSSGMMTTVPRMSEDEYEAFENAVKEAERLSGVPAPVGTDPTTIDAFELWRKTVNESNGGRVLVPEIPTPKKTQRVMYEGPWIERPSIFMLSFDPTIETIQEQPYFFHRIPCRYRDVLARADDDPDSVMPYYRDQVERARAANTTTDHQDWNKELADVTGLSGQEIYNENGDDCEIMEVWTNDPEMPFVQILNRTTIINKHPDIHPFCHGMKPFFAIKNTPIENQFIGMSEFEPSVDLYEEENKLADLLMDAVVMSVLPVLLRTTGSGFNATTAGAIRPGSVLDIRRPDALKTLDKMNPGILDAFRQIGALRDEIDNTHATWGNVRGAGATIGRVSATDSVNRMNQALVRQKIHAQRDETDLQDLVVMILGLMYQFGKDELKRNVRGGDIVIPRERFLDAIYEDFKFRGATKAINKAERVQNLNDFYKTYNGLMATKEKRRLMKEVLYAEGLKCVDVIVDDQVTEELIHAEMLAKQQAMMPQPQGGGPPGGPPGSPPPGGGGGGPLGVVPAPTQLGQELPLDVLEQMAQGVSFESQDTSVPQI